MKVAIEMVLELEDPISIGKLIAIVRGIKVAGLKIAGVREIDVPTTIGDVVRAASAPAKDNTR